MLRNNEYFEGKVKSIGFESQQGPTSVGVMEAGTYEFSTAAPEKMTVITGAMDITLDGESSTSTYNAGQSFNVPGSSKFTVVTKECTSYLCNYQEK